MKEKDINSNLGNRYWMRDKVRIASYSQLESPHSSKCSCTCISWTSSFFLERISFFDVLSSSTRFRHGLLKIHRIDKSRGVDETPKRHRNLCEGTFIFNTRPPLRVYILTCIYVCIYIRRYICMDKYKPGTSP